MIAARNGAELAEKMKNSAEADWRKKWCNQEIINKLVDNVIKDLREAEDSNLTNEELFEREKIVKQFAEDYYNKKVKNELLIW